MAEQRTYFDTIRCSLDGTTANNIDTFIEFASTLPDFLKLFGSLLSRVESDINGNIKKIRKSQEKYKVETFSVMLSTEREQQTFKADGSGTTGLLWLLRACEFVFEFLCVLAMNPQFGSSEVISQAYSRSLQRHHNFIIGKIFKAAASLAPSRADIIKKLSLAPSITEDEVLRATKAFCCKYYPCAESLTAALIKDGIESPRPNSFSDFLPQISVN